MRIFVDKRCKWCSNSAWKNSVPNSSKKKKKKTSFLLIKLFFQTEYFFNWHPAVLNKKNESCQVTFLALSLAFFRLRSPTSSFQNLFITLFTQLYINIKYIYTLSLLFYQPSILLLKTSFSF